MNEKKLIPIRGTMWDSIHQYMRLERQQDDYIITELDYFLNSRTDLENDERAFLKRVARTMVAEQRKECDQDGVRTNKELKEERKNKK